MRSTIRVEPIRWPFFCGNANGANGANNANFCGKFKFCGNFYSLIFHSATNANFAEIFILKL